MATGGGETLSRSVGGVRSHPPREAIYSTGSEIEPMEACPEAHSRRRGEIIRGSYRDATIGASFQLGHGPRDIDDQGSSLADFGYASGVCEVAAASTFRPHCPARRSEPRGRIRILELKPGPDRSSRHLAHLKNGRYGFFILRPGCG